jgi:methylthioribose-1-phosphate isomerase
MIQTLEWTDQGVRFLDQTKLPTEETYVTCETHEQVADVIRNMVVRGAPAIGVAAAMGIALGVNNSPAESVADLKHDLDQICDLIGKTRPTAVNLFWAIRRMQKTLPPPRLWDATALRSCPPKAESSPTATPARSPPPATAPRSA